MSDENPNEPITIAVAPGRWTVVEREDDGKVTMHEIPADVNILLPLFEHEAGAINRCKADLLSMVKELKLEDCDNMGHSGAAHFATTFVSSLIRNTGWGDDYVKNALRQFAEQFKPTIH